MSVRVSPLYRQMWPVELAIVSVAIPGVGLFFFWQQAPVQERRKDDGNGCQQHLCARGHTNRQIRVEEYTQHIHQEERYTRRRGREVKQN